MPGQFSNLVITYLIEHKKKFLLVKRVDTEKNFPGYWAFPGGRALVGENIIDTVKRKIYTKTGLKIKSRIAFVDTYSFKYSTGLTVLVSSLSPNVQPNRNAVSDFVWVKTAGDLEKYKRIPGIDNHLANAIRVLKRKNWLEMDFFELTQNKFLNR